jgi:Na+/H+-dicarboxylate symporter
MLNSSRLNQHILFGVIFGVLTGIYLHQWPETDPLVVGVTYWAGLIGGLYISLLKMILIPLIFCTITAGIGKLGQQQKMGKIWLIMLTYAFVTLSIAIGLGLLASHLFKPGLGLNLAMFTQSSSAFKADHLSFSEFFVQFTQGLFVNPFAALASGKILPVVVFSIIFGMAIAVGGSRYNSLLKIFQEGFEICMVVVNAIVRLAPIGVGALLIKLIALQNLSVLGALIKFIGVVFVTTLVHGLFVLPLILYLVTRYSPLKFFKGAKDALLTAFFTSSSNATLPVSLKCVASNLGVAPEIAGFVIPFGATMNMDGSALYESLAALFVANLAGIDLSLSQELVVFFTAMIVTIGAPGIPSAGMVTMIVVLESVGLPVEAIAILLPIDRLLDTFRTSVNVEGDIIGSMIVQKFVGKKVP